MWWPNGERITLVNLRDNAKNDIPVALHWCPKTRVCVQAGGNCGLYPVKLAEYFSTVYTFEPEPINFWCLEHNVNTDSTIIAYHGALGSETGCLTGIKRSPSNCGMHQLEEGSEVPVVTIDSLNLLVCDLIWLDIEGYELNALKGAEETVLRCKPTIVVENNGLSETYGIPTYAVKDWLTARGYAQAGVAGNDEVFTYGGNRHE